MKNRAKCKLCESIIESFHSTDFVHCKCDEIAVHGGEGLGCSAKNWNNFLRIDDEGNEIMVTVKESANNITKGQENEFIKEKLRGMADEYQEYVDNRRELILDSMKHLIKSIEGLPQHAQQLPVTQSELSSVLSLVLALFRLEDRVIDEHKDENIH